MSHNVTMKNVRFTDLVALGNIVKELSGGLAVLDTMGKQFRTYVGQPDKCDAVIKMPGIHDIGLLKQGNAYVPVFDPFCMDPVFKGGTNYIGKIQQEYVLREAEYEAAQRGMTSSRVPGPNGVVTLELVEAS